MTRAPRARLRRPDDRPAPRLQLTGRGTGLLVAGAVTAVAGHLVALDSVVPAGLMLALAPGVSWVALRVRPVAASVRVRRTIRPSPAQAGQDVLVETQALPMRPGWWSRGTVTSLALGEDVPVGVRDDAPLRATLREHGHTTTLAYHLTPQRRGRWDVGPLVTRRSDPFGLVVATERVGAGTPLVVWPAILPAHVSDAGARSGLTPLRFGANDPSDEDTSLRTYHPGDDLRRVHWASAARHGELMVRTDEGASRPPVCVLLDAPVEQETSGWPGARRPADDVDVVTDWVVSVAASLALHLLDAGHPVRLVTTDAGLAQPGLVGGDGQRGARWARSRDLAERLLLLDRTVDVARTPRAPEALAARDEVLQRIVGESQLGEVIIAVTAVSRLDVGDGLLDTLGLVGGSASRRLAVVVPDPPEPPAGADAERWLLRAGWRVVMMPVGRSLSVAWSDLVGSSR